MYFKSLLKYQVQSSEKVIPTDAIVAEKSSSDNIAPPPMHALSLRESIMDHIKRHAEGEAPTTV